MKKKKRKKNRNGMEKCKWENNSKSMKSISNQVHDLARFFILRPKLLMFLPSLWKWIEWMMKKIKIIWETSKTKIRSYLILSLQD